MSGSFLEEPAVTPQVQARYDEDLAEGGYVWNMSRLWAHQPDTLNQLFALMSQAFKPSELGFRQRGMLVTATAFVALRLCFSTIDDSLGAHPDAQLVASQPAAVTSAVTYGRPPVPG